LAVVAHLLHEFLGTFGRRIAEGATVVASTAAIEDGVYDPTSAALRALTASAIFDGFGMASMA
jgi:hypothetical protein